MGQVRANVLISLPDGVREIPDQRRSTRLVMNQDSWFRCELPESFRPEVTERALPRRNRYYGTATEHGYDYAPTIRLTDLSIRDRADVSPLRRCCSRISERYDGRIGRSQKITAAPPTTATDDATRETASSLAVWTFT